MDLITLSLDFLTQIKYWHFKTPEFETHVVLGELYDDLGGPIDELCEVSLALYPEQANDSYSYDVKKFESKEDCINYILQYNSAFDKAKKDYSDSTVVTLIDNVKIILLNKIYKLRLEC